MTKDELTQITNDYSCVVEESLATHLIKLLWQIKSFRENTNDELSIVAEVEDSLSKKLLELIAQETCHSFWN